MRHGYAYVSVGLQSVLGPMKLAQHNSSRAHTRHNAVTAAAGKRPLGPILMNTTDAKHVFEVSTNNDACYD